MIKILFFTVTVLISANSIGQVSATDSTETGVTLTKIDIDNTSELPAEYPGGPFALLTFLSKNMIYPQNASENNIQGKVFIQFIIEKDGTISDVKALNSVLPSIDTEAVRVVSLLPEKWEPAKQNGVAVRSYYKLPFMFRLK